MSLELRAWRVSVGGSWHAWALCGLVLLLAGSVGAADAGGPTFTLEQATQGSEVYLRACSACHGEALVDGAAPVLTGDAFTNRWGDRSAQDLIETIAATMPPADRGSIADEDVAALVAHVLNKSGHSPGEDALHGGSPEASRLLIDPTATPGGLASDDAPVFIQGTADAPSPNAGPTQDELSASGGAPGDWLHHTHDYLGSRYAALNEITTENVSRLRESCSFQTGEQSKFQSGPIVYDGRMYVTTTHATEAVDATTCRLLWRYDWTPRTKDGWLTNRGVALKQGRVVRGTADGYLLALNAETGGLLWARRVADSAIGETLTMPPMIFEDLVLIGPAGSENGISGWVGAFRLSDGSPVWRFKTVPGADDPQSENWSNPNQIHLGGGAVWTPFSLDVENAELYVAVTNPAPDLAAHLRPGDNLYSNSLVALDARTGELRWYKQFIANDSHDWDFTQVSPLFRSPDGARRMAAVGKDGLLRILDRSSREVLYETPVTTRENADTPVTTTPTHACPGVLGGVQWNGPSYSPKTDMLYTPAVDWCATFTADEEVEHRPGQLYMGGGVKPDPESRGWITAVEASSGEVRWRYESEKPIVAAVTTTAGGLVLSGELTGDLIALDAESGKVLHRFPTGAPIGGGVVTYAVGGKQYVAVTSGRPSRFFQGPKPGSPTVFILSLP